MMNADQVTYLEELYQLFLQNPGAVSPQWQSFFAGLSSEPSGSGAAAASASAMEGSSAAFFALSGHLYAQVNPLKDKTPDLPSMWQGPDYAAWRARYCSTIGVEFMHLQNPEERAWMESAIEKMTVQRSYSRERQKNMLMQLTMAEGLERYLGSKFPGAKRFSLEGGEALIPMIHALIHHGGSTLGVREVVIGMAHRGRLNVLVNILGKRPADLFDAFAGKHHQESDLSGDVKYHQGFSCDIQTGGELVHIALAFNPSHLEIVTPVVLGSVRVRQQRYADAHRKQIVPLAIHGDAAFAGQGVVMETFNMSQTRGYTVGGTVHLVINNQVGFTTSDPSDARSTLYCSDVSKMVEAPIFHVNGDDVEACVAVMEQAIAFRQRFKKDVVIDLICYRRHGHNEADEPAVTQPLMYQQIRQHPSVRQIYANTLEKAAVISAAEADALVSENRALLDKGEPVVVDLFQGEKTRYSSGAHWASYTAYNPDARVSTALTPELWKKRAADIAQSPAGMVLHPRVAKMMDDRAAMAAEKIKADWGFAENLAYASLLAEGYSVRVSGQDCGRGTFFHRHAVLHDTQSGNRAMPLLAAAQSGAQLEVIDSVLSEEAVMAFEYGFASTEPHHLVIWEAQFGDFANGAQVVIDQFISSGEQKWGRLCGLTLLLPHGYEGQGPEHSSARLERYLQLCAQNNMYVCVPSTPAQVFHMLRRQVLSMIRIPLVVMSPKSLLRHRLAVSELKDFTDQGFLSVIPDPAILAPAAIKRVIFCSGKVYYDLYESREAQEQSMGTRTALVRVEQLYPFPEPALLEAMKLYSGAIEYVWCQEEPRNQGAWSFMREPLEDMLQSLKGHPVSVIYAGRPASASPAVGTTDVHNTQQKALLQAAFGMA